MPRKSRKSKFKNPYKQKAFEEFVGKNKHDLEQFNIIWKRSVKNARRIYGFGKHKGFKDISKNAEVFAVDEIRYKGGSINNLIETAEGNDYYEKFENTEKTIYEKRTQEFFNVNGSDTMKYGNEEKTMNEWFEDYKNGKISKETMNEIIKEYKDTNPVRHEEYYADSNSNNDDFKNNFY